MESSWEINVKVQRATGKVHRGPKDSLEILKDELAISFHQKKVINISLSHGHKTIIEVSYANCNMANMSCLIGAEYREWGLLG